MSAEYEVVEAKDLDAAWPDIRRLFLELREYEQEMERPELRADWEDRFRDRLAEEGANGGVVMLACVDGRAIGFMIAHMEDSNLFAAPRCEVTYACVSAGWRGKGVGRALLSRVEAWAGHAGLDEVWLEVLAANATAVEGWRALGFSARSHVMTKSLP